jgi:hypothetical protein
MSEKPTDNMPCPHCGSTHLVQHVTRSEDVHVTYDGELEYIAPRGMLEIQELWCPKCDKKLWER